ncbi:unnamed protein product [Allacma fusca]|uniref:Uncharacterized protein n=1 Tax=Allacma fusca TaxID=39272 RepID=A0A8J2LEK3_9HEXA|nr:unnamed protein product [Allacma fusca]
MNLKHINLQCSMLLRFYSLKYLELGDALALSSRIPVFTYVLLSPLHPLGEECTRYRACSYFRSNTPGNCSSSHSTDTFNRE